MTSLRDRFEAVTPGTAGLEEELMLLDAASLDLLPVAAEALSRLDGDERFKLELPASQLEIVLAPRSSAGELAAELANARRRVATALEGLARPAAGATHPFAAPVGELNGGERYEQLAAEHGEAIRRQLVCALQIHVAVGGAERTIAVHDAVRSYLPDLAALAANGPFHEGRDTGFASWRPQLCTLLPRQGVPPPLGDFAAFERALAAAGEDRWWWELRPNARFGTLELRVADAQTTVGDAEAVASVGHALVGWIARRIDGGERPEVEPEWRIAERRWAAMRWGVGDTALRGRVEALLAELEPFGEQLGCSSGLRRASELLLEGENGAARQRAAGDPRAAARLLADRFLEA